MKTAPVGLHCDGGGLYLQVTKGVDGDLCRSWVFRFSTAAGQRKMGLGALANVTLSQARERAAEARRQRQDGADPIEVKRARNAALAIAGAKTMTFDQCRDAYIAAHRAGWRNAKHAAQWTSTLETYVTPVFGLLPVQAIDVGLVMKVIEPLWSDKPETGMPPDPISMVRKKAARPGIQSTLSHASWGL